MTYPTTGPCVQALDDFGWPIEIFVKHIVAKGRKFELRHEFLTGSYNMYIINNGTRNRDKWLSLSPNADIEDKEYMDRAFRKLIDHEAKNE